MIKVSINYNPRTKRLTVYFTNKEKEVYDNISPEDYEVFQRDLNYNKRGKTGYRAYNNFIAKFEKNKVSEEQLKKEEDDIINKFLDKDEEKRFRDVSKEEYNELYGKWTKSKNKTKFDEYEDENTKIWYDWEDK